MCGPHVPKLIVKLVVLTKVIFAPLVVLWNVEVLLVVSNLADQAEQRAQDDRLVWHLDAAAFRNLVALSLIHISEPTRRS